MQNSDLTTDNMLTILEAYLKSIQTAAIRTNSSRDSLGQTDMRVWLPRSGVLNRINAISFHGVLRGGNHPTPPCISIDWVSGEYDTVKTFDLNCSAEEFDGYLTTLGDVIPTEPLFGTSDGDAQHTMKQLLAITDKLFFLE
jgi:hypothetical protein